MAALRVALARHPCGGLMRRIRRFLSEAGIAKSTIALLVALLASRAGAAQGTTSAFVPGTREIYSLDLTSVAARRIHDRGRDHSEGMLRPRGHRVRGNEGKTPNAASLFATCPAEPCYWSTMGIVWFVPNDATPGQYRIRVFGK